ncbi:MAG: HIT family protein [Patescibacteria group bacterium]
MSEQSVFTRIVSGEIPCYKVYEDEHVFAFLDINPVHPGHVLVVPKIEIDQFYEVPEPYYQAVFAAAKMLAPALREAVGTVRIATVIAGFDVPHFHYHLIPADSMADIDFSKTKKLEPAEMEKIRAKIVSRVA